jgi:hypothetical protein
MSNLKISQLPSYTGNTSGSWLVMNNSGETTTYKVQRENLLSGFQPSGSYATLGSNRFNGNQTITGSLLVSGSAGEGTTLISGNVIQTNLGLVVASVFASTGQVNLFADGTNNDVQIRAAGTGSILLQNRTRINGNTTITGSLNVTSNAIISGSISVGQTDSANKTISFASSSINPGAVVQYYRDVVAGGRLEVNTGADNRGVVAVGGGQNGTKTGSFLSLDKNTGNTLLFGSSSISIESPLINVTGSVTTTGNVNVSGSIVLGGVSENIYFNSGSGIGAFVSYDPTINGVGGTLSVNTNGTVGLVNLGASGANGASLSLNKQIGKATLFGSSSISLQGNNIDVTGSVNISQVMTLAKQNPLPTGTTGSLAVSGSGLYFHNGTSWSLIS